MIKQIVGGTLQIGFGIIAAPFLIVAFLITKMLGGDPFSLDGMGIGFLITALIAGGLAIATGAFALGYFL